MGTKNNPGRFDCFNAADPDEPRFTLLARDALAAHLISIWSKLRMGDHEAARVVFEHMLGQAAAIGYPRDGDDVDKAIEAMDCSMSMFTWRKENRP